MSVSIEEVLEGGITSSSDLERIISRVEENPHFDYDLYYLGAESTEIDNDPDIKEIYQELDRLQELERNENGAGIWLNADVDVSDEVRTSQEGYLVDVEFNYEFLDNDRRSSNSGENVLIGFTAYRDDGLKAETPEDEALDKEPATH